MFALPRHQRTHRTVSLVGTGLLAGLAGTAVMTATQTLAAKLRDEKQPGQPPRKWSEATAPAQVAERLAETAGETLPLDKAPAIGNAMHWLYGTSWGAAYGIATTGLKSIGVVPAGVGFGAVVWAASYAELVPMGIYKPPWKYPAKDIALDALFHMVYGLAVAVAFDAVQTSR